MWGHGILSLSSSSEGGSSREIDIPVTHSCEIAPVFLKTAPSQNIKYGLEQEDIFHSLYSSHSQKHI